LWEREGGRVERERERERDRESLQPNNKNITQIKTEIIGFFFKKPTKQKMGE